MSRWAREADNVERGFPRVSGDEPSDGYQVEHAGLFSPRERG